MSVVSLAGMGRRVLALILLAPATLAAINRRAVVARHSLRTSVANASVLDPADVFTLGNGDFAFNVDATGLQTFNDTFATQRPRLDLNTLASWGWHSLPSQFPDTSDATRFLRSMNWSYLPAAMSASVNRTVPYLVGENNTSSNGGWTSSNPHRMGLGQLSLRVVAPGDSPGDDPAAPSAALLTDLTSELDTWDGGVTAAFTLHTSADASPFCANAPEGRVVLSCDDARATLSILYVDYGTAHGSCPTFVRNASCTSSNASAIVHAACDGQRSCVIEAVDGVMGDPCRYTRKRLVAVASCSVGGGSATPAPSPAPLRNTSSFAVTIATAVHPDVDLVATQLTCTRTSGTDGCPTALRLALPYSIPRDPSASAWCCDDSHASTVTAQSATRVSLALTLDDAALTIDCQWSDVAWTWARTGPHAFALFPPHGAASATVQLSCLWAPAALLYPIGLASSPFVRGKVAATRPFVAGAPLPFYAAVQAAGAAMLSDYWSSGSFVELAAHGAPDALELERRVVLSRYLVRVNSAGASPPQETGLISNSWSGKFHLEMRFWHHAHWPVWGNSELLARSWGFYVDLLPNATSLAAHQGYEGARWLKMLGLANPLLNDINGAHAIDVAWLGTDSSPPPPHVTGSLLLWDTANNINPVLVWQQPHVIWAADAQRRDVNASRGDAAARAVVDELAPLVAATADFMATFAFFNESSGFYELGGPILGGEEFDAAPRFYSSRKPVFETVYFAAMLDVANEWRVLQGLPSSPRYAAVAAGLGGLQLDPAEATPTYAFNANSACCYVSSAQCPPGRFGSRTACSPQVGHPMPAGVLGWVDGRRFGDRYGVDATTANATVAAITERWAWSSGAGWGWDMPLVALGQVRQGWAPESAVAMLLMNVSKNTYIRTGYNNQGGFLYLPGNGGTLLAVGMMAAGTSTSPRCNFPVAWGATCEGFAASFQ